MGLKLFQLERVPSNRERKHKQEFEIRFLEIELLQKEFSN